MLDHPVDYKLLQDFQKHENALMKLNYLETFNFRKKCKAILCNNSHILKMKFYMNEIYFLYDYRDKVGSGHLKDAQN